MFTPVLKLEHADSRGEIYSITLPDDRELMLLHSKKGTLRGGHSHDVDEIVVMLTGKMHYHKKITAGKGTRRVIVQEGDTSFNTAGIIHMGEFKEDSWLLEWKINTKKGEGKNTDYAEWRERVRANAAEFNNG